MYFKFKKKEEFENYYRKLSGFLDNFFKVFEKKNIYYFELLFGLFHEWDSFFKLSEFITGKEKLAFSRLNLIERIIKLAEKVKKFKGNYILDKEYYSEYKSKISISNSEFIAFFDELVKLIPE